MSFALTLAEASLPVSPQRRGHGVLGQGKPFVRFVNLETSAGANGLALAPFPALSSALSGVLVLSP